MHTRLHAALLMSMAIQLGSARANEPAVHQQGYVFINDFRAEQDDNALENPHSDIMLGIGLLARYSDHVDWGIELSGAYREYDTPPGISGGALTTVSDDMRLSTLGVSANARYRVVTSYAELYAGAGAGMYFSTLTISASTLGLPGKNETKSTDPGAFYLLGTAVGLTDTYSLGIEYRHWLVRSSFDPVSSSSVNTGGDGVSLVISAVF